MLGLFVTAWHVEFLEPMHRGSYKARAKNNAAFVLFLHSVNFRLNPLHYHLALESAVKNRIEDETNNNG